MEVKYVNIFCDSHILPKVFTVSFLFRFFLSNATSILFISEKKITLETTFFYLRDCYLHTKERDWKYEFQGYNAFVSNWLVFL